MSEIKKQIEASIETKKTLLDLENDINNIANILIDSIKNGNKIMIAGNGGSAADAQHMAGEIVGRFKMERKGMACIALTTDTSVITAWVNDYDYSTLFERQIEALGKEGDTFIGISTSGNSENIVKAVDKCKELNITPILFLGKDGGKLKDMAESKIIIKSDDTARVQESHILLIHILCGLIEKNCAVK